VTSKYFDFCDEIVREYFADTLLEGIYPPLQEIFDFEFMPEPYLPLLTSDQHLPSGYLKWLHVLSANPGEGLSIQRKSYVCAGKIEGVSDKVPYSQFAHRLFRKYEEFFPTRKDLKKGIGHFRSAQDLAELSVYPGALQIDSVPWHSERLDVRHKDTLPSLIKNDRRTKQYCALLRDYLHDCAVISIDGARGRSEESISRDSFNNEWMKFKADLIGMDIDNATFSPILKKGKKITAAAMNVGGSAKVMYCVRGHNHLPGKDGLRALAKLLVKL
jgi:hypothetical protein